MPRFSRSKYSSIIIKSISIIAILLVLVRVFLFPKETNAAWFDDNYGYRQKVTVGNSGAADSNKKVKFDVDTATLISAGKMTSTCADTRFTDGNGKLLQYYLDASGGACNTASTDFYVLIPTINGSSNDTYVYMYYGYPSAAAGTQASQISVATFSPTSGPTYATEEKGTTPVLYWKFDEGYGTTANDASQYTNNGTFGASTAAPSIIMEDQCVAGKCIKFDGSNDYISKSYSSDLELDAGTASFTVSAWFKHSSAISGTDTLIARADGVNGVGYKVYMNSSGFMCFGIDAAAGSFPNDSACGSTSRADSQWHHVTAVKSSTTSITLYIDGKQIKQTNSITASSISGTSSPFYIGIDADGSSNPWDGFIDEVKVLPYAKTAAQIQSDFIARGSGDGATSTLGAQGQLFLSTGLVGYWKMDENTGTSIADASGNGGTGTFYEGTAASTSGPTWATGKFGSGTNFAGTNDVIRIPETSAIDLGSTTDSYTVSAWVNTTTNFSASDNTILAKDDGSNAFPYKLYFSNSETACFQVYDGSNNINFCGTTALNDGQWHFILGKRDVETDTLYLFVDGLLQGSANDTTTTTAVNNDNLAIGNSADSNYNAADYTGKIDDVRVYNRALSDREIRSLYEWAPGPVGWWQMDEATGTTANDSSSYSNSGSLTGEPLWHTGKIGSSVSFDNVNDTIDTGAGTTYDNLATFSVEAWIYPKSDGEANRGTIVQKADTSSPSLGWDFQLTNGVTHGIQFDVDYDTTDLKVTSAANSITLNTWQHVSVTWDGSTTATNVHIYVNGVEVAYSTQQNASTTRQSDSGHNLLIGNNESGSRTFDGYIDDVRIYNHIRTVKQIVSDMNAGHPAVGSPVGSAVAYWNFDEGYGTTANGSYANSNSLTLNTASWTTSGKLGKAWNGDGTNWLTRANDEDFNFRGTDDFSISMWFKSDASSAPSTQEYLLSKAESSAGYRVFGQTDGDIVFGTDDDSTWSPDDKVGDTGTNNKYDGNWHHIVATKTGTTRLDIYVDGALVESDTSIAGTATLSNTVDLFIGDRNGVNGGDEFNGDIDEIKIYRYALNADNVKTEYNQGKSQVLGSLSTESNGTTASSASAREYCVPGDTSTCSAPVGEWKLDDNTGSTAYDTSGKGNNLTLLSSDGTLPLWSRGKVGSALLFDGATDYANNTSISSDLVNVGNLTVSAWIYRKSTNSDDTIVRVTGTGASPGGNNNYDLQMTDTTNFPKMTWDFGATPTNQNATSTVALSTPINTWVHLTAVRDATANVVTFYENGRLLDTVSFANDPTGGDTSPRITVGANTTPGGRGFDGIIDHLRIYNYARTPAQVAWDYNRGGPVGWWKFDECQGETAYDASGNSNNGTITPGNNTGDNDTAGTCNSGTTTEMWDDGTTGKYNSSLGFDGTNDHVSVADNTILDITGDITVALWAKPSTVDASTDILLEKGDGSVATNRAYGIRISNTSVWAGTFYNTAGSTAVLSSNITPEVGRWDHVVINRNGTTNTIYINGKSAGTNTLSGTLNDSSSILAIGKIGDTNSNYFHGLIDDVRIFNYSLTDAQIRTLYNDNAAVRFGPETGSP